MNYLQAWVSQLVVIVLFAVILELLLPAGTYQKYVRLVVGLVLIVALLDPLIALFHMNPSDFLPHIESSQAESDWLTSQTNRQKKEIEQQQDAYIQKQMAVQMKEQVKEGLRDRYGVKIEKLSLSARQDGQDQLVVRRVTVSLVNAKADAATFREVEPVTINVEKEQAQPKQGKRKADIKHIRAFLAQQWQLDERLVWVAGGEGD
ncbi:MAG: stage III sporulation protein AF [Sporolactobacillus sp.]